MRLKFKTNKKKGLSTIIVTVLLVALTIVVVGIVWVVMNNMIKGKMIGAEVCFGSFGKVFINDEYTCYNSGVDPPEFQFSISVGDIDVERAVITISSAGMIKSYTVSGGNITIPGNYPDVKNYTNGIYGEKLILPSKNTGATYITNSSLVKPDSIKIAPVIKGQQCEVSDTLLEVNNC